MNKPRQSVHNDNLRCINMQSNGYAFDEKYAYIPDGPCIAYVAMALCDAGIAPWAAVPDTQGDSGDENDAKRYVRFCLRCREFGHTSDACNHPDPSHSLTITNTTPIKP